MTLPPRGKPTAGPGATMAAYAYTPAPQAQRASVRQTEDTRI